MNLTPKERLEHIVEIIESVDQRCMAADGPVTPTLNEMRQEEISEIYELALGPQECPLCPVYRGSNFCANCGRKFE